MLLSFIKNGSLLITFSLKFIFDSTSLILQMDSQKAIHTFTESMEIAIVCNSNYSKLLDRNKTTNNLTPYITLSVKTWGNKKYKNNNKPSNRQKGHWCLQIYASLRCTEESKQYKLQSLHIILVWIHCFTFCSKLVNAWITFSKQGRQKCMNIREATFCVHEHWQ